MKHPLESYYFSTAHLGFFVQTTDNSESSQGSIAEYMENTRLSRRILFYKDVGTGDMKPRSALNSAQKQPMAGDPGGLQSHSHPCTAAPGLTLLFCRVDVPTFSSWNNNFKFRSFPQKVHKLTVQTPKLHRPPLSATKRADSGTLFGIFSEGRKSHFFSRSSL